MEIFTLLAITLISAYFYYRYKNRRLFAMANKFPGPISYPIVGNIFTLYNNNPSGFLQRIRQYRKEYGPVYRTWIGNKLSVIISDSKIAEIILSNSTKNLAKNRMYDSVREWLGDGLLMSHGAKWHARRKIITPTFHFSILEQFVHIMERQSEILVKKLKAHEFGHMFDIYPYLNLMTLDVVCQTSMGIEINAQTNVLHPYCKAVRGLAAIITEKFAKIWMQNDFLFALFAKDLKKKYDEYLKTAHNFTLSVIKQRRKRLMTEEENQHENTNDMGENDEINEKKKPIFMDMLLKSTINGIPLSDKDIQEEVDTFMFEGHDTVASGLSFTLYLLSRHKNVQDKLFDEITNIFGTDKTTPATYRDLHNLKYMDLVIKESLRMYPPVPIIGRKVDEEIPIDQYTVIPIGTTLVINFYFMFNDSKYFKNPHQFLPERFDSNEENLNCFTSTPFSAGSRNCIGQRFALLEMKSLLSKMLRHYELLPEGPDVDIMFELVLRSQNGINIGLRPRHY